MSSTNTNTTAPKPGSLKAAHARIDTLAGLFAREETPIPAFPIDRLDRIEEAINKPHQCPGAKVRALPVARQYTGRVDMPSYGIPLPAGIGFHGYVTVRMTDQIVEGQVEPPSEAEVMLFLRDQAEYEFPGFVDVSLADISVLPEGWNEEGEEE